MKRYLVVFASLGFLVAKCCAAAPSLERPYYLLRDAEHVIYLERVAGALAVHIEATAKFTDDRYGTYPYVDFASVAVGTAENGISYGTQKSTKALCKTTIVSAFASKNEACRATKATLTSRFEATANQLRPHPSWTFTVPVGEIALAGRKAGLVVKIHVAVPLAFTYPPAARTPFDLENGIQIDVDTLRPDLTASQTKADGPAGTSTPERREKSAPGLPSPSETVPANEYFRIGYEKFKDGNNSEAAALFKKGLEIAPNNAAAHFYLGQIYKNVGMLENAIEEYQRSLASDPKSSVAAEAGAYLKQIYFPCPGKTITRGQLKSEEIFYKGLVNKSNDGQFFLFLDRCGLDDLTGE